MIHASLMQVECHVSSRLIIKTYNWTCIWSTGGTLKIYGASLSPDVPYKTLLLSINDNAAAVVREMLDKYGLSRQDPAQFCIVQVNI